MKFLSKIRSIISNKKFLYRFIGGLSLLVIILLGKNFILKNMSIYSSKGHPAFYVYEKHFKDVKSAAENIKEIPFITPQNVKQSYELLDIVYIKTKDNTYTVDFNYKDNENNELIIQYRKKGDNIDSSYDAGLVNPDTVRIDYLNNHPVLQPIETFNQKFINLQLYKYNITANLSYSREINAADKADDEMLAKITESFLQSEIFDAATEDAVIFNPYTFKFDSYKALKKTLSFDINMREPKYVPEGYAFKYIIYKNASVNLYNNFNITYIYENPKGARLSINYMSLDKCGIHVNNNDKLQQRDVNRIEFDSNGKVKLVPYAEMQLAHLFESLGVNAYIQYKPNTNFNDSTISKELTKVIKSME